MIISDKTIICKSLPQHYIKEESGKKANTVRFVDESEDKSLALATLYYIKIINSDTNESFSRVIQDITRFEYADVIIYIFSWWGC